MKKLLRPLLGILVAVMLISALGVGALTSSAQSADPADSYVKQTAPYEDSSIDLWFEHSFKKVMTSDTTPSDMDTYSVYMAKNEIESAQFVLCSDETKAGMTASVTNFTNENGDTIPAEIYYQLYVTTSDLATDFVLGATEDNTIIREGETPDPIAPLKNVSSGVFQLNAGKSQAFLIRITSDETTPAGWYSAQLDIKNANGQIVKTATVYTYVWDFVISEETVLETALFMNNTTGYGGTYQGFYDYLLENRICAMDIPGGVTATNPYLTNPRVSAIRVTYGGGGANGSYGEVGAHVDAGQYRDIYNELSTTKYWDAIKDKFYFYTADEPIGAVWNKWTGSHNTDVDGVKTAYDKLQTYWPDARSVVPFHENHPYPYFHYNKPISEYADYELCDATQAMIDQGGVSIWCPQLYAFTPQSELTAAGYQGLEQEPIRELSASISALYSWGDNNSASGTNGVDFFVAAGYYNWNNLYGEFTDRIKSEMVLAEEKGDVANSELWAYSAGWNKTYTYTNHLIENTGLQTKMMFWQLYQEDVTGYLYYGTNNWSEYDGENGGFADATVTGAKTNANWKTNKHVYSDHSIYGNGVLFYGNTQGKIQGKACIGTLRVELMRDGIEEYQMLTMLEEYMGESAAKAVVGKISNNVADYLSLPNFDDSAFDASMDEYDIMASVRRQLGDTLEACTASDKCNHSFGEGVVVKEAGCLTIGTMSYTCTKCSAEYTEDIPALHSVGDCFTKISGSNATCTTEGTAVYQCTLCGYKKTETTPAHHSNPDCYSYEVRNDTMHNIVCTVCNKQIETGSHVFIENDTATCTEAGELLSVCRYCGYSSVVEETEAKGHYLVSEYIAPTCTEEGFEGNGCLNCDYGEGTVIPALGHSYGDDNICIDCGYELTYILGDLDGDFEVSAKDLNIVKRYLGGLTNLTEIQALAGDVNGDGDVSAVDMNRIVRYLAGTIAGL